MYRVRLYRVLMLHILLDGASLGGMPPCQMPNAPAHQLLNLFTSLELLRLADEHEFERQLAYRVVVLTWMTRIGV
eukprot:CAMPEP_0179438346 /NCGR_PEP_ID=MMETSP0799-20121207/22098_1 /TAXON_ID=46947 /ORGANISM="Geminigera cryophila, Strain CCMP2564" /LENGTH=74 /DNA_ID=CAMNT_0021219909 /DNA_START=1352 /DNA_END=1576 /DNA_ORIENTATION=+